MATGTTLYDVTDALVTLLDARPGLDDVTVTFAKPMNEPGVELADEAIWFGGATTDVEQAAFGGTIKADFEQYELDCVVQVLIRDGRTEQACALRAKALFAELQQALAAKTTKTLVAGVQKIQLTGWEHQVGPVGDGTNRGARYDVTIFVMAELKP